MAARLFNFKDFSSDTIRVWQLVTRTHGPLTGSFNVCNAVIPSGKPTLRSAPIEFPVCLNQPREQFLQIPQVSNRHGAFQNNVKYVKMPAAPVAEKDPSGEKVTFWIFGCIT